MISKLIAKLSAGLKTTNIYAIQVPKFDNKIYPLKIERTKHDSMFDSDGILIFFKPLVIDIPDTVKWTEYFEWKLCVHVLPDDGPEPVGPLFREYVGAAPDIITFKWSITVT